MKYHKKLPEGYYKSHHSLEEHYLMGPEYSAKRKIREAVTASLTLLKILYRFFLSFSAFEIFNKLNNQVGSPFDSQYAAVNT